MTRRPAVFRVRAAELADLPACAAIYEAGEREIAPEAGPDAWSGDGFEAAVAGEEILVAEAAAREIAGFVSFWRPQPFVHFLHVRPAWRRQGAGRTLLERVVATVAGPVSLKCRRGNAAALAFYARLGWTGRDDLGSAQAPYVRLWLRR